MKNTKKKALVVALAVCLVALVSMSTLAWFTASDSVKNNFFIANSEDDPDKIFSVDVWEDATLDDSTEEEKLDKIEFPDILPGDDLYKEVNVENTGYYDQYVRVTVTITDASIWQIIFNELYVPLNKIATDLNENQFDIWSTVYNADEDTLTYVLYYDAILPAEGEDTVNLFTNIHIPEMMDRFQAAAMSGDFDISVFAEAVQTEHVGDTASAAFATVGMEVAAGDYTIGSSGNAFINLATLVNAGLSFEGEIITLTDDVNLAGTQLAPIGTEETPFKGTFDGANYTISNLSIADGLFAYVGEGAVIKNVKFDNVNVGGTYSAVVANYAEDATFENIQVLSGAINVENYGASIVFEAYDVTISNCVNYATVNAGFSASGIGAWVYTSTVEGCENYGDLIGGNRAGGICANFSGTMTNCTNNGDVTSTGGMPAGGIIGVVGGATTIENCTNNGDVTTTADNVNASAAGILAQTPSAKVTITSCTNTGTITAEKSWAAGIGVSLYGGITANDCVNEGDVNGGDAADGIVAAKAPYGNGKNTENNCTNTGTVTKG